MKIAVFHELTFGGALRAANELARELGRHNEVEMFVVGDEGVVKPSGVTCQIFSFRSPSAAGLIARIRHDFNDLIRLAWLHFRIAQEINARNYDVVLVHPSRWTQAPFILSFLKVPTVYYAHEALRIVYDDYLSDISNLPLPNRTYEKLNRIWRKLIDRRNFFAAGKILTNSRFTRDNLGAAYGREATVCHLGVDTKLFHPMRVTKKYDVLFFGSPVDIEGYDLLLAAQTISKRKWKIRTLQRKSNGKGVSDKELVRLINQSRMAVSFEHNSPFGLNMIEANACEVPVMAVNEGGYKDGIVQGRTGNLVAREAAAVARAINDLLKDQRKARRLGERGLARVRSYWNWECAGKRLSSELKRVDLEAGGWEVKPFLWFTFIAGILSLITVVFFRQLRPYFPAPEIGPHFLLGYAQYFGYPLWFEPALFAVLISIPFCLAVGLAIRVKNK